MILENGSNFDTGMTTVTDGNTFDQRSYVWLEAGADFLLKWWPIGPVLLGVFGNILSLCVTSMKDNRRISTCVYMSGLAVVDSCVLITDAMYRLCVAHNLVPEFFSNFIFLAFMKFSGNAFGMTSGIFLAEMSLDRAIAVTYPMKAASICTGSRATKAVTFTFVVMMVCNSQTFFTYRVPDTPNGNLVRYIPNAPWLGPFLNIGLLIFGTILPFAIVIVCNCVIIIGVRRATMERQKIESNPSKKKIEERNLTAMLLMTSFAYLVCSCPLRIYETMTVYDLNDPYWRARYSFEWWICAEIWHLNFAVNFYIYFLGGGKKFRQDAKSIFIGCCKT